MIKISDFIVDELQHPWASRKLQTALMYGEIAWLNTVGFHEYQTKGNMW